MASITWLPLSASVNDGHETRWKRLGAISLFGVAAVLLAEVTSSVRSSIWQDTTLKLFGLNALHRVKDTQPLLPRRPHSLDHRTEGGDVGMHAPWFPRTGVHSAEQRKAHSSSMDSFEYSPQPQGFQGQIALLGSLAAVALTSLVIATMALTSGMIGLAGVAFGFYSVAIALQWCIPYVTQALPMQMLALPVAICTILAYRKHHIKEDGLQQFTSENERVITPYQPQRTIRPMSQVNRGTSFQTKELSSYVRPANSDAVLAQQKAYLLHLYQLPATRQAPKASPLRRAIRWVQHGLFGKSHPNVEDNFPLDDTAELRQAKRALQRTFRLEAGADVQPEEQLTTEELLSSTPWPQRSASEIDVDAARELLQRIYDRY